MNNGIKPLNDTLDKLNYITLLTNVSSAAYDMDKIKEFKLEFAKNNDKFIGFGEKEYLLNDKDVIIKSENDIICLAGILGANEFGVSPQTKNIYVEFANFNYATIRRTAQRLNIRTDASRRFSKPIANYSAILSNNLLKQMFDKTETLFIQSDSKKQKPIKINSALSNTINGTKMGITEIKNKLYKYGFKYEDGGFIYPPYRTDIIVAQDVIEEITKTLKVNEMEDKSIDTSGVVNNKKTEFAIISKIKNLLVNDYFNEVKTYNMISEEDLLQHNYFESNKHLKIVSSHNKNRSYLRNNLLTSMLNVYDYNNLYKNELLPIFEIQKIFAYEVPSINVTLLTQESY
jgi:phenylalanyl-tRNA synthetase beta chain